MTYQWANSPCLERAPFGFENKNHYVFFSFRGLEVEVVVRIENNPTSFLFFILAITTFSFRREKQTIILLSFLFVILPTKRCSLPCQIRTPFQFYKTLHILDTQDLIWVRGANFKLANIGLWSDLLRPKQDQLCFSLDKNYSKIWIPN